MWIMSDCSSASFLKPAEGDSAVGCYRVLCCLHPDVCHHGEHRVPLPEGPSLTCFPVFLNVGSAPFSFSFSDLSAAFCDHRAVCSGRDGGLCNPLPNPPAAEAPPVAVGLTSGSQDQRVLPVRTQRFA